MIPTDTIPDGYTLLRNGKLRAKAGRGKIPYGLTQPMLLRIAELRDVSQRPKNRLGHDLKRLFEQAVSLISDGCDMAREGEKDRARNWWRFFTNANVVQIFENPLTQKIAGISPAQFKQFSDELYRLKTCCHPDDLQDWNSDIAAIRQSLEEILKQVSRPKKRSTKNQFPSLGRNSLRKSNNGRLYALSVPRLGSTLGRTL